VLRDGTRSRFPVGINLFGSMSRMAMSLGVDRLDDHGIASRS
jgi:4-hydroxy-3-polyprenylbenzoate decarboxylase